MKHKNNNTVSNKMNSGYLKVECDNMNRSNTSIYNFNEDKLKSSNDLLSKTSSFGDMTMNLASRSYRNIAEVTAAALLTEKIKRNSNLNLSVPFSSRRNTTALDQNNYLSLITNKTSEGLMHRNSFASFSNRKNTIFMNNIQYSDELLHGSNQDNM